jgi:predicted metal-dependent enzyme (double-stranded beta helix superfamily)
VTDFGTFIDEVETLRRRTVSDADLVPNISRRLASLNRSARWLPAESRSSVETGYAQHVLYVSHDGGLSVAALVWKAGQMTPIHNHVAWCVVGVYEGTERETRYRLEPGGGSPYLVQTEMREAGAGAAGGTLADGFDIHSVANAGDSLAISIHVYGADLRRLGSSINRRFDHLPIRQAALSS